MKKIVVNVAAIAALAFAPATHAQQAADTPPPPEAARPRRPGLFGDIGGPAGRVTAKPQAMRFSAEDAVAKAIAENRDLKAAGFLIREAEGHREGAGRLSNPELEITGGPGTYGTDTGMFQGAIMQKFPVTSRLRLEENIADTEIAAAREEVLIARRKLIGEVKSDAVRLIALRDEIALLRGRKELAEKYAAETRDRASRGEGDTLQADMLAIESADNADLIARAEAERAALVAHFRTELGLRPDADADISGELPDSRDDYGNADPSACPECRKMTLLADASQKAVELEQAKKWQDVGVGLYGQAEHTNDLAKNHQTLGYVGVRVTIPIPLWNDNGGAVRSARARRDRLKQELAAEILRLDGDAQSARRELDKLVGRLPELRGKLVPAARALTGKIRASLAKGEGVPADLFRAMDKQSELERRELNLRRDIALAFVRLETALSAHPAMKDPVVAPELGE